MTMRLIRRPGQPNEEIFELRSGRTTLGRGPDNDIAIVHRSLSRSHVRFELEDGVLTVTDLGSKNGVEINGELVEEARLEAGDSIRCGDVVLRLEAPREVEGLALTCNIDNDLVHRPFETLLGHAGREDSVLMLAGATGGDRAAEKLEVLLKVSQALSTPAPLSEVLERIVDLVLGILDVHRAAIILLDSDGNLQPAVVRHRPGSDADPTSSMYSETIARHAIDNSVAALFTDATDDSRFRDAASVLEQTIRSCMCAPLKPREQILGVLYVDNMAIPGRFAQQDLEFLSAFANQAAVAIENAQLTEDLEKEAVRRSTLQRFFPPSVVGSLLASDGAASAAVETEVTALFADISGYTALSSALHPRRVLELLNAYFPLMAEAVFRHEGTLEKYIGDAILAVWGAPLRRENDAMRAVRAAIDMQRAIVELNRRWSESEIAIHVGLCTGPVAAGTIGTDSYLQYATIGDTTNVASRICGQADAGEILISASTQACLPDAAWSIEAVPAVHVKGKDEPLQLYRVVYE